MCVLGRRVVLPGHARAYRSLDKRELGQKLKSSITSLGEAEQFNDLLRSVLWHHYTKRKKTRAPRKGLANKKPT